MLDTDWLIAVFSLLKRVTRLRDSHTGFLPFKMALKFKPVAVTAVLICDSLFSV